MSTTRRRGQASAEAVLLWSAVAGVGAVLAVGLVRSGAASLVATALGGARPAAVGDRAGDVLARSLRGGPGAPTLLAARALVEADIGRDAADKLLRARLLALLAADGRLAGDLDVTRLVTAAPGLSLRASPAGPAVVVGIATLADEPGDGAFDLRELGALGPDAATTALAASEHPDLAASARIMSRFATAFDVAGAILGRLHAPPPGPLPGQRAGDVVFCRHYEARWFRGGVPAYDPAMGDLWRLTVLRGGRFIADRIVTRRAC